MRRLAALLFLTGLAGLRPAVAAAPARPNVLLILADDMGIGDVSHLNPASLWRTPHLDRLAREGMVFSDAHSASGVCTPTRYTLLTGRYSWRGRLKRGVLQGYSPPLIEPDRQTIAGFLRAQGYTTALFGKWHLGLDWPRSGPAPEDIDWARPFGGGPRAHGFDRFLGISASLDMPPYVWLRDDRVTAAPNGRVGDSPAPRLWRAGPIGPDFKMEEVQPRLTAETISFLGERAAAREGRPFFALLSLASPHTPTLATGEFAGSTPTPYGDFVRQVDADVGRILAELERLDLARSTLVVFTTDNGYAPAGDIPNHRSLGHDSSGGFRGAKSDSYEGGHRVPFLVRWPGVTPAGSRSGAVIGHLDLFATLAEVLGVPLPADVAEDSASFLPLLRGQPGREGAREGLVHHSSEGEFSIRVGRWKLILAPGSGGWGRPTRTPSPWTQPKADSFEGLPPFQLYDLEADPRETTNLEARHPEIVQRLGRLLRGYIERGRSTAGPAQPYVREGWPQVAWMERFGP